MFLNWKEWILYLSCWLIELLLLMEGLGHLLLNIFQSSEIGNVYWPLFLVVGSNIKVKVLTLITIDRWKEPCNKVMATKMNHNLLIFHVEGGGILVFNAYILKSSFCSVLRLLYYYEMEWQ